MRPIYLNINQVNIRTPIAIQFLSDDYIFITRVVDLSLATDSFENERAAISTIHINVRAGDSVDD